MKKTAEEILSNRDEQLEKDKAELDKQLGITASLKPESIKTAKGIQDIIFAYQAYCAGKGIVHNDSSSDVVRFSEAYHAQFPEQKELTEDEMDLMQYVTNLLYDAFTQGIKVRIPAGIGGGVRNVDSAEFDKWLEEQMTNIEEFLKSKEVTNETIEKWGDNMEEDLYERNHSREETRRIIENRIHGAKAMRDGLIKPIK